MHNMLCLLDIKVKGDLALKLQQDAQGKVSITKQQIFNFFEYELDSFISGRSIENVLFPGQN